MLDRNLIYRLPDVEYRDPTRRLITAPAVRVIEDLTHHPRHTLLDHMRPNPQYVESHAMNPLIAIHYSPRWQHQNTYVKNRIPHSPWHVWLTNPLHAIYDDWAVELLPDYQGPTVDYPGRTREDLNFENTPLTKLQRQYLAPFFGRDPQPLDADTLKSLPKPYEPPEESEEPEPKPSGKPAPAPSDPKKHPKSSGWISPKGVFYFCPYYQHSEWEYEARTNNWFGVLPKSLAQHGWVAVSAGTLKGAQPLSQSQLDTLFDLGWWDSVEDYRPNPWS